MDNTRKILTAAGAIALIGGLGYYFMQKGQPKKESELANIRFYTEEEAEVIKRCYS
jgi:hypothetical protein